MEALNHSDSDSDGALHKPSDPLYPLVRMSGDPSLKLPALLSPSKKPHLAALLSDDISSSSSPPSSSSTLYPDLKSLHSVTTRPRHESVDNTSATTTPSTERTALPPIASVVVPDSPSTSSSELNREFGSDVSSSTSSSSVHLRQRPKISYEERVQHAALIRALLIHINTVYVKRFGADNGSSRSERRIARSWTPFGDEMEVDA
ncbi:hypothetical protein FRC17_008709 [Serendipita sp. 399]|nr:hypothetical protein FRC17_008709 [Serendipita sp. 399]